MHRMRGVLAFLLALGATSLAPVTAWAAGVAFTITDDRITESSGLASQVSAKRYWTVNDSGDSAIAYALSSKGKVAGTLSFRAEPIDVEAVAVDGNRLYVADIGDNAEQREFVTVYFFDQAGPGDEPVPYKSYDFEYPDGAHDAETLLVDGAGRLYIVTKESKAGIYAAPGQPSRTELNRLVRIGDAPAYVTDGTFLPGDRRIALRTYLAVYVVDAISYQVIAREAAPLQPQGESIAVNLSGRSLLLGSEGANSKVYSMPVPTEKSSVPKPVSTPPGSNASPTPSSSGSPEPTQLDPVDEPTGAARGTWLAVGLAGVVALVAAAVVVVVKRP